MRTPASTVDRKLARIASWGYGVVTRTQLLSTGVTARQIKRRVDSGNLIRVHRGVYRVGHRAPSLEATYLAAVLAAGEGALLSAHAAAHLFALTKGTAPTPEVIARTKRRIEGVTTHRSHSLMPAMRPRFGASPSQPCRARWLTWRASCRRMHSHEPATRPGSATTPRPKQSRPCSRGGRAPRARRSSEG